MLSNEFYMFKQTAEKAIAKGCICKEDRAYPLGWGHGMAIKDGGICSIYIKDNNCPVHGNEEK